MSSECWERHRRRPRGSNLRRLGRPDLEGRARTLAAIERLADELGVPVAELLRPGS